LKKVTTKYLKKKGINPVFIPGILLAISLGWSGYKLLNTKDYHTIPVVFPQKATISKIEDGDTLLLNNNTSVRLIGINAPDKNEPNYKESKIYLEKVLPKNKTIYLEYDRYQDDKFGRILAWVWVDCEQNPKFLPADYMHKSGNKSMPGLTENPEGCKNGKLINEELVENNFAETVIYKDRGELKYQNRISRYD